jgi:hypothetical protein
MVLRTLQEGPAVHLCLKPDFAGLQRSALNSMHKIIHSGSFDGYLPLTLHSAGTSGIDRDVETFLFWMFLCSSTCTTGSTRVL